MVSICGILGPSRVPKGLDLLIKWPFGSIIHLQCLRTGVYVIRKTERCFFKTTNSKSQVSLKEDDIVDPILFLSWSSFWLSPSTSEVFGFFWQLFNSCTSCICSYSKVDFVITFNMIFGLLTSCLFSNIYSFIRHISSKKRRTSGDVGALWQTSELGELCAQ